MSTVLLCNGKIKVTVVRPSSTYGPRCRLLTDRAYTYIKTMPPIVLIPGDCMAGFSIVNVKDLCNLIILATFSEKAVGQIYNAGPSESEQNTYRDFINAMAHALGKRNLKYRYHYSFYMYSLVSWKAGAG